MDKIIARRNGAERQFTLAQWNSLPKDKYGWEAVDGTALPAQGVIKNVTANTYIPPEVKEVQAQNAAAAVADNKPETEVNSEANADTITHVVSADDVKANEGAGLKEGEEVVIDKKDILSEKEVQLEKVRAMVAEGKDRKAVAAELGIHWTVAQKLIDQVNSEANADTKE